MVTFAWSRLLPHLVSQGEPVERRLIFFVAASSIGFLAVVNYLTRKFVIFRR